MRIRAAAVASAALAISGFLLAPAAQASVRPPVQVNGNQLRSALLPASYFGSDYRGGARASSGKRLWRGPANKHVASMSCGTFEYSYGFADFGETAVALSYSDNSNPGPSYPNTEFYYVQSVSQFATAKAATAYFNQAHAKYAKCTSFSESLPGGLETTTLSVAKAAVGKYHAFAVSQASDASGYPGAVVQLSTLVTVAGTDVFTVTAVGGTNDAVPGALMLKLISRVSKLR